MVSSGPALIECYCELYIHHSVVNAAIVAMLLVSVLLSATVILAVTKRRFYAWLSEIISVKVGSKDNRESLGALSPRDCEDVTCKDQGKENL